MDTLKVYLLDTFAGNLTCRKKLFTFQYDSDYLQKPDAKALSFAVLCNPCTLDSPAN